MTMFLVRLQVLSLLLYPLAVASRQGINVYHRFYIPHGEQDMAEPEFIQRGTVVIEDNIGAATYQASPSTLENFSQFARELKEDDERERIMYQVAIEREGRWDVSSVKWCHLPKVLEETLVLHMSESSTPYAADYFVSPIPHDGGCPAFAKNEDSVSVKFDNLAKLNTTVVLKTARLPPLPELRAPPPLTPEGKPAETIPEKSFIQKYWMYVAAGLIALFMAGGPPEEGQQGGGGQR
ncbi:hypothetical protein L218DRAFT_892844 [Marasmius fiardii PR-910]|nr:hypothetical protein L218DRAFT_892844 [Marasmius fiardii PR-910]